MRANALSVAFLPAGHPAGHASLHQLASRCCLCLCVVTLTPVPVNVHHIQYCTAGAAAQTRIQFAFIGDLYLNSEELTIKKERKKEEEKTLKSTTAARVWNCGCCPSYPVLLAVALRLLRRHACAVDIRRRSHW